MALSCFPSRQIHWLSSLQLTKSCSLPYSHLNLFLMFCCQPLNGPKKWPPKFLALLICECGLDLPASESQDLFAFNSRNSPTQNFQSSARGTILSRLWPAGNLHANATFAAKCHRLCLGRLRTVNASECDPKNCCVSCPQITHFRSFGPAGDVYRILLNLDLVHWVLFVLLFHTVPDHI
jgi:hypothetical protein